ncbi:polysaccharide biosynthesis protein [Legionella lytica]|uniref:Polysaccharide biosynthesis protein n=1 Tax=Legionella lytica TaxID=96232 RepID=A0ABY4Y7S3_9GAMM|nr:nucleoside-diphosphate sugar epimerase/dehydratase [Legionella lytica]USQ13517.1 polysaccharide biosynthesis protein [Legionella lytica]
MKKSLIRNSRAWFVMGHDLAMALFSWFIVHSLISGQPDTFSLTQWLSITIAFAISIKYFRVYAVVWKNTSTKDVKRSIYTVLTGSILFFFLEFLFNRLALISRSEIIFYPELTLILILSTRYFYRQYLQSSHKTRATGTGLIVIGSGAGANLFLRENDTRLNPYKIVAILDDNPLLHGTLMQNYPIIGSTDLLLSPKFIQSYPADELLIAIPSLPKEHLQDIYKKCSATAYPVKILPSLMKILEGSSPTELEQIKLEDLLGRAQIELAWNEISTAVYGKRVVVTGGGGSIGSELCRQIAKLNPEKLIIIDNSEFNLYQIEHELRHTFENLPLHISLTSVLDKHAIHQLFEKVKPQIVFHAAAYKHVPMLEEQVRIAVMNNVLGTQAIAEASVDFNVNKFILISTDKAVNPTNIMGTTKRVAEIYCQNLNGHFATQFITVRFGNVLGSAGSVVPLFKKQLKEGGPLTVTHPDITRYFMTIPEACQLILQAMVNGHGGEVFVLDMGEPVKINYLAEQIIRLAGKEPHRDIQIKYTGLRPGEKLYEELFHETEQLRPTMHEKILQAKHRVMDWQQLIHAFDAIEQACHTLNDRELRKLLVHLVPEYCENTEALPSA